MKTFADIAARTLRQGQACQSVHVEPRIEHTDPRERLLMLYGVWVKCLPHQAGRRRLVERCIASCKSQIGGRRQYGIGNAPTPTVGGKILVPFESSLYRATVVDVDIETASVWVDSTDWQFVRALPVRRRP